MPQSSITIGPCPICGLSIPMHLMGRLSVIMCGRCGEYCFYEPIGASWLPLKNKNRAALASYLIRKMYVPNKQVEIDEKFFVSLASHRLPSPAEALDTFLLWCAKSAEGRPGAKLEIDISNPEFLSTIGVVEADDFEWVVRSTESKGWLSGQFEHNERLTFKGMLSISGWARVEQLQRAHVASRYAFFARKFDNADLDHVFDNCLRHAVLKTGFELRTVTQKAGPVDAIIEDEIRRCRFLIADLTDGNNGAYWEAGFAEGLGKPVIYICRDVDKETGKPIVTHFDTDHRHTVRWNLDTLDETAKRLKAVIRNTLLGDAVQSDE